MAKEDIQANDVIETLKKAVGALRKSGLDVPDLTKEDLLATQAKIDLIDEASFSKEVIRKNLSAKLIDRVVDSVIANEVGNDDEAIEAKLRSVAQNDIPTLEKELKIMEERLSLLKGISDGTLTFRDLRVIISDGNPSTNN